MNFTDPDRRRISAFTLIELMIVLLILGILAAIVVSRFGNLTSDTSDTALASDLQTMRNAITLYAAQHTGIYPTGATVDAQLTQYTDINGGTSTDPDATHTLGPYLPAIPALPVGIQKGSSTVTTTANQAGFGWYYDQAAGQIYANADPSELDSHGKAYINY